MKLLTRKEFLRMLAMGAAAVAGAPLVSACNQAAAPAEPALPSPQAKALPLPSATPLPVPSATAPLPTPTGEMIVDFLKGRMPAYLETGLNLIHVNDLGVANTISAYSDGSCANKRPTITSSNR